MSSINALLDVKMEMLSSCWTEVSRVEVKFGAGHIRLGAISVKMMFKACDGWNNLGT